MKNNGELYCVPADDYIFKEKVFLSYTHHL